MKTSLVIMAAGIGSRYGGGIKQLAPVGPNGEIIMDYSIHDAIQAGFNKIIFIIRKDIDADFKAVIGDRMEVLCKKLGVELSYAYQELDALPDGVPTVPERKKTWGTGQAVLACKHLLHEPFVVINADDYYGKQAFRDIHTFLLEQRQELCMAGFILNKTLSDNGGVTRGVCQVDENGYLKQIHETHHIVKTETGASADGIPIDASAPVSMNMWGLTPDFLARLERGFADFFRDKDLDLQKAEFLLPVFIGRLLEENQVAVKVLATDDDWFGVTFKEDKQIVADAFRHLISDGIYAADLFSDLN